MSKNENPVIKAEEHLLEHRGRRYRLEGECLAWRKEQTGTGRYTQYNVYQDKNNQLFLNIQYITQWQGEEDVSVIEKISKSELNRRYPELAREAGLEEILGIDQLPKEQDDF